MRQLRLVARQRQKLAGMLSHNHQNRPHKMLRKHGFIAAPMIT
jgi:hypothetical protein